MRIIIVIILIFLFDRVISQTRLSNPPTTITVCAEMKKNCKTGKIITNEKYGIGEKTVVYLEGQFTDITEKKLGYTIFTLIGEGSKNKHMTLTDSLGHFKLVVEPGVYTLSVNAFGYPDLVVNNLKFSPGDKRNLLIDVGEYCCNKTEVKRVDFNSQIEEFEKQKSGQK
ncbi:MAG: carboxypeptidase regulatory-like domain-containing protein [Bacteroidetes bacterium]|nr:carboxypeptidase regulatory-like domain-containing protein [Bacteroidota bacterium]